MPSPWSRVVLVSILGGLGTSLGGQVVGRTHEDLRATVAFEGIVVDADGAPAEGAVVVSSAGGEAATDRGGRYRLEIGVPLDARSVRITAVGSAGGLRASASVDLVPGSPLARVPPLELSSGGACPPSWIPTFEGQPGVDDDVSALVVFDDGSGPALYAGGIFEVAGGVPASGIAKWDGATWAPLGSGMSGGIVDVSALVVFDDGNGPALYAGGSFLTAGGVTVNRVARWDGSDWTALGSGVGDDVHALAVFDDGGGDALYAGGDFTTAGGVAANRIAKWDGASWSALGSGMSGTTFPSVLALAVFDDGTGPALHAGGSFTSAGGVAASRIAKWDGSSWESLGSGLGSPFTPMVRALAVFDDGEGPALHVGGTFATAGGTAASGIARWDGSGWTALASGVSGTVNALAVFDDGGGPALYAGGFLSTAGGNQVRNIATWDGASWNGLGGGLDDLVFVLTVFDGGSGPALYAGGRFTTAGARGANRIAEWRGESWDVVGNGLNLDVLALAVFDDGEGSALHVGGGFTIVDGMPASRIAKWDGSTWTLLGSGVSGFIAAVQALTVFDDGSGPALFAGGLFSSAGGVAAKSIAKWDGSGWSALGSGVGGSATAQVSALTVFDDGGGPALYAGGDFTTAGGATANNIAKWKGESWSALGSGFNGSIHALAVFDDGGGPALYAAGSFLIAGGISASSIARWDGSTWSPLGSGIVGTVETLRVFDDGGGPALYAGGSFTTAGGLTVDRIARWDGSSWSPLAGGGVGSFAVYDLAVFDDGSGDALYAGGSFTTAGGEAVNRIAKWDGSGWSVLGSGTNDSVYTLAAFDDGTGDALFAGGEFTSALDSGDSFLARWGCPDTVPPTIVCPGDIVVNDRGGTGEVVSFTVTALDEQDPSPTLVCVPPSGSLFLRGTTLVTCTATDAHGNQATCQFTISVKLKARKL
jgi:hypothetical protein